LVEGAEHEQYQEKPPERLQPPPLARNAPIRGAVSLNTRGHPPSNARLDPFLPSPAIGGSRVWQACPRQRASTAHWLTLEFFAELPTPKATPADSFLAG
jgi:hypothetical protein